METEKLLQIGLYVLIRNDIKKVFLGITDLQPTLCSFFGWLFLVLLIIVIDSLCKFKYYIIHLFKFSSKKNKKMECLSRYHFLTLLLSDICMKSRSITG